ncbi:zinc finger protein 408-like [Pollicipes pollicipes]|uniref:zinc finger protein 408-like n=1 Tax=Pollicipes pollicipes TaxID=41117 RepID=UPI001884DA3A|nr:zinc finger protein 408-like [Pollicipes pollicipes]
MTVEVHRTKNSSKGIINCFDLKDVSEEEIVDGLTEFGVTDARRIKVRRGLRCPEPGCRKRLSSQQRLSDHRAWHRGETVCPLCGQRLSSRTKLRAHVQHRHPSAGVPCRWPGCGQRLRNSQRLSDHLAWHRGETLCPVCQRRFSNPRNLRDHLLLMPPPPPPPDEVGFACPLCHKRFRDASNLSHHAAVHRGETTCPRCGLVLSTKRRLRCHLAACRGGAGPATAELADLGWLAGWPRGHR